jgi:lactoylglutathione lyase
MKKMDYAIVFVSDMNRSVAFYRDRMGLPLRFESPGWSEFATEGTTLALHKAGHTPAGRCQPGFAVENLSEFHQKAEAAGMKCIQPPKVQDFGGVLAVYADPDGLPISVWGAQEK